MDQMKGWEFLVSCWAPSLLAGGNAERQREKMFSVCLPVCVYDIQRRTEANLMG